MEFVLENKTYHSVPDADNNCVSEGFHTTTLPNMAGAAGKLPAIAVKLKGVIANTNPSSGR